MNDKRVIGGGFVIDPKDENPLLLEELELLLLSDEEEPELLEERELEPLDKLLLDDENELLLLDELKLLLDDLKLDLELEEELKLLLSGLVELELIRLENPAEIDDKPEDDSEIVLLGEDDKVFIGGSEYLKLRRLPLDLIKDAPPPLAKDKPLRFISTC